MSDRPLEMRISLNALEHLGMNLYSNVPSVLSEIVANTWDADATNVSVHVDADSKSITITDDGTGMTRDEVVDRFLTVAFKRRDEMEPETAMGRRPMGRKGIGKLSSFSIAQSVDIYTSRNGQRTSFRMDRESIKDHIEGSSEQPYHPEELSEWPKGLAGGTRIVLSRLDKNFTEVTLSGLRKRIARRFSIIGPDSNFLVTVNGQSIGPDDRGYHGLLEYLWTYGNQKKFSSSCKKLSRPAASRTKEIKAKLKGTNITVSGWVGTVSRPSQLKDDEGENLNRIAIFVRGKLAQEDVLDGFGEKEIYADYIVGELHCDDLDIDDLEDMATTSRQSLKQDDPRFVAFRKAVLVELRNIAANWSEWRRKDGTKSAMKVPAVSEWMENLKGDTRKSAERWIGRLNTIRVNDPADTREMLKASILAFESYRRKQELAKLDDISDIGIESLLSIFENIDDLELSYYGQIVEMRLAVVRKLQEMVKDDVVEVELQKYIFDHLWLIDSSWERAKGTEHIETTINKFLGSDTKKLGKAEQKARVDIGYRTTTAKHVIVELKRRSVATPIDRLTAQVRKYLNGSMKLIEKSAYSEWPLEIICLVGKPPPEWHLKGGRKQVRDALLGVNARLVFYDELIGSAQQTYSDYLEKHKKIDRLWEIFASIDDFGRNEP